MGGIILTSTHGAMARAPRSLCLKSKTQGTASAATPMLSGHLNISLLLTVVRCCSICLARGTSRTKQQAKRYSVLALQGLVLEEVVAAI